MGKENVNYLLVDIGNTNLHFLSKKAGKVPEFLIVNNEESLVNLKGLLPDTKVFISSVNKDNLEKVISRLNSLGVKDISVLDSLKLKGRVDELGLKIDNLNILATDLLVDIVGLDKSGLIANFGTATKFLFLDKNKVFKGGTLGLGLYQINRALGESADMLEVFPLETPDEFISFNTKNAINIDTIYGSANKLISLYNLIREKYDEPDLKLTITGGDAKYVKQAFDKLGFKDYTLDDYHSFKGMIKALNLEIEL